MSSTNLSAKKIVLVYNAPDEFETENSFHEAEEDTVSSAKAIAHALEKKHIPVMLFPVLPQTIQSIKTIQADCIVNLIEWTGRDLLYAKKAFEELEALGIPFTGGSSKNYVETTDKIQMKELFLKHGVPSAHFQQFYTGDEKIKGFLYPVVVKVACEHSGVGLYNDSLVADHKTLKKRIRQRIREFSQPVLVEEYIDGREFEVTLLSTGTSVDVLPITENIYAPHLPVQMLTYERKWSEAPDNVGTCKTAVAKLSRVEKENIEELCKKAFYDLHFTDYARFDIRMKKDGSVLFLETNSNPGIDESPDNGLAVSYMAAGMDLGQFMEVILRSALFRFNA